MEKGLKNQATWDDIDLKWFKRSRYKFPTHVIHSIAKFITDTLPVIQILRHHQHMTSDLVPWCGMLTETLAHLYEWFHTGSHNYWKTTMNKLMNWMQKHHTYPNIIYLFETALLYLSGQESTFPIYEDKSDGHLF